jgi:2-oxoacid:acceptor oxidoreductase gamma subunit (pyruvate/2-ketoisovalerate family)
VYNLPDIDHERGLMSVAERSVYEIRWHGRGGQGAVTSAKILADAAFRSGFAGVTSQPSFGAERRGAPITASTRLAHEPIRVLNQVTEPDIVVVLDDSLLQVGGATHGVKPGGMLIVNTTQAPGELGVWGDYSLVTADVTGAAVAVDLIVAGQPMVSTAILGSFAAATGLIDMESVELAIGYVFSGKAAVKNIEAARIAFECTQ